MHSGARRFACWTIACLAALFLVGVLGTAAHATKKRVVGEVTWFNQAKGHGFLAYKDTKGNKQTIFVDFKEVRFKNLKGRVVRFPNLVDGESVSFCVAKIKGQDSLIAKDVQPLDCKRLLRVR
jgi:cold shock CspA family protein